MKIRRAYALVAIAVFALEVAIALFVRDRFVRPFVGDSLAVVLVYLALRAVTPLRVKVAVALAFATAIAIEFGQYFDLLDALGLRANPVVRVVLGAGFDPMDFAAYAAGTLGVLAIEARRTVRARP
ncbi:MAG: hypothetical protein JWN66_5026 [Sphingomonas bacterium]|uniref:ribosomal maturation YjgA family protein n=1 Tax=Sphingomonas bacterium TaxID=1895847 RepID=UPI002608B658|nr:DUF2809 domain-containing protein [Sphingomonas bacterium]MDB5707910.1 hypothetical protein [Sphingomonas bacterium]